VRPEGFWRASQPLGRAVVLEGLGFCDRADNFACTVECVQVVGEGGGQYSVRGDIIIIFTENLASFLTKYS
jgi:hypothetical protein